MYCRNCGTIIGNDTQICSNCGQNPAEGSNYCPECGHFCIPGDSVCIQCHTSLIKPTKLSEKIVSSSQPMAQAAQQQNSLTAQISKSGPKMLPSDKKYCRNCGLIISKSATYCEFCNSPSGSNYCHQCGSGTTATDTVCSVCAAPLSPASNIGYIPAPPPAATYQQQNNTYRQNYNNHNYNNQNYNNMNQYNNQYDNTNDDRPDFLVTLLLSIFLGYFGVHRFYTGHILIGVIQFLTGGGCGIWYIIDIIMIAIGSYTDSKGRPLKR